tara:strand:+ start:29 stop:325 length:297 start_codon:yes stop_codon:yes gene_type:complete
MKVYEKLPFDMINSLDLAELLEEEGYALDEDTGEVYTEPNGKRTLLIMLAALGKLYVRHEHQDHGWKLCFFIPHWRCYDQDDYCKQFPHEQQCKCYDL